MLKKKKCSHFQRIIKLFTRKFSLSSQEYGFGIRNPRSGIQKKPIPDPGSMGQKGTGFRIRIRNTAIFGFKILEFSIVGVLQTIGAICPLCGPALQIVFTDGKHIFQQVQWIFFLLAVQHLLHAYCTASPACLLYSISCLLTVQHLLHAYCTASPTPCTVYRTANPALCTTIVLYLIWLNCSSSRHTAFLARSTASSAQRTVNTHSFCCSVQPLVLTIFFHR